jgi:rhamnose transport system permease protein
MWLERFEFLRLLPNTPAIRFSQDMRPNIALGWELEVITAVILGGVSIAGGSGTIPGVVLAVFILGLATFGLSLVNVPGIVISVLLLIVSIAMPIVVRRLMRHRPQ